MTCIFYTIGGAARVLRRRLARKSGFPVFFWVKGPAMGKRRDLYKKIRVL